MTELAGKYAPVFTKDGNRLIVTIPDFIADDEDKAWEIGMGAMFVEGILYGFKYCSHRHANNDVSMA